mmetsp:Transcript_12601/g.28835  ORF Transcript_12601/g.28835 Transcript_12601/m.28835 type:complete len:104 (-) Transcript_12601:781-1092(-)
MHFHTENARITKLQKLSLSQLVHCMESPRHLNEGHEPVTVITGQWRQRREPEWRLRHDPAPDSCRRFLPVESQPAPARVSAPASALASVPASSWVGMDCTRRN